mgnify:CR=1 FL=1
MNHPQCVLVTGASSGIGREMARCLAARGINLILTARREDRLRELADELTAQHPIRAHVLPADLAHPNAGQRLAHQAIALEPDIDGLINNAGFGLLGPVISHPADRLEQMIQLNIAGLTTLTAAFAPRMATARRGWICNVASIAGWQPLALMATYAATKAYVLHFSEALWQELRPHGVRVSCLCPGPTHSEFFEVAQSAGTQIRLDRGGVAQTAAVAEAGVRGMLRGTRVVTPGVLNKLATRLGRLTARSLLLPAAEKMIRSNCTPSPPS